MRLEKLCRTDMTCAYIIIADFRRTLRDFNIAVSEAKKDFPDLTDERISIGKIDSGQPIGGGCLVLVLNIESTPPDDYIRIGSDVIPPIR